MIGKCIILKELWGIVILDNTLDHCDGTLGHCNGTVYHYDRTVKHSNGSRDIVMGLWFIMIGLNHCD